MELEVNTFNVLSNKLHAPKKLSKPMGLQVKTNNKKGLESKHERHDVSKGLWSILYLRSYV